MKKLFAFVLALALCVTSVAALADGIKIAVPNDATNEGRALLLLEAVKQGGEGMTFLPDLILRDENGRSTEEYRRIYGEG